jgi:hypothetical protein
VKVSESSLSARAVSCTSALDNDDQCRSAGEGLAEGLSRIVIDAARIAALHQVLGPFCHKSRNILNSLKISLYLAQRLETSEASVSSVWEDLEERYRAVEGLFDRLQMIWRPLTPRLVPMSLSLLLEDRRKAWVADFAAQGRTLKMSAGAKADAGEYDPHCLGLALDAFISWRASAGEKGQEAELLWWTRGGRFELEWVERRPPGSKIVAAASARHRHEPLALPYLARVVSAHGGTMDFLEPAGSHLRLSWPQVARRPD